MKTTTKKETTMVAKTFRLHPATCELLRVMADREGLSQARVVDHLVREFESFLFRFRQFDAALETVSKSSFSASTRVDLRFNDDQSMINR